MPIVVEYQPSFVAGGQLAYEGGLGQYDLQRGQLDLAQQQLAQQDRQFQQRLRMQGAELAQRQDLWSQQLMARNRDTSLQYMAQREAIGADLAKQRMVQEGYANTAQMGLQEAMMRENAALAKQQMVQKQQVAFAQLGHMEEYIARHNPSYEQIQSMYQQFEQVHGWNPGNFRTETVVAAQQAAEETQKQQKINGLVSTLGVSPDVAASMIEYDSQRGMWVEAPITQVHARAISEDRNRTLQKDQFEKEIELKQQELFMQFQAEADKVNADAYKQQATVQKEQVKQALAIGKAAHAAWKSSFDAQRQIEEDIAKQEAGPDVAGKPKAGPINYMNYDFAVIGMGDSGVDDGQVVQRMLPGTIFKVIAPPWHEKAGELILMRRGRGQQIGAPGFWEEIDPVTLKVIPPPERPAAPAPMLPGRHIMPNMIPFGL